MLDFDKNNGQKCTLVNIVAILYSKTGLIIQGLAMCLYPGIQENVTIELKFGIVFILFMYSVFWYTSVISA